MPDNLKRKNAKPMLPAGDLSSPLNFLLDTREPNILEFQTLSSLFLLAEAMTKPPSTEVESPTPRITHAASEEMKRNPPLEDFSALFDLLAQIRGWSESNPSHRAFLDGLRDSMGESGSFSILFQNLFPQALPRAVADTEGKSLLTPRQLDVLREAGKDHSQQEIAETLKLSVSAVNMHFQQIYKQLGCNRPMQAVAKAIAMGYLETDDLVFIHEASGCTARDFHPLGYCFSTLNGADRNIEAANLKPLAEFGLLLLALSGCVTWPMQNSGALAAKRSPLICELNQKGDIMREFGRTLPAIPDQVALAPPCAAKAGFTPGHLYVSCQRLPQQGLNSAAVVEFTPEGEFVRAFCGGADYLTSLRCTRGLAFASDGRLLVTGDRLLEFRDGGATVRSFANDCCLYVHVDELGRVYQQLNSSLGCSIKVMDAAGQLRQTFNSTQAGDFYGGIAVTTQSEIAVSYWKSGHGYIVMHDAEGRRLRRFPVSGMAGEHLGIAASEHIYVACYAEGDVKVFTPNGELVQRFNVSDTLLPRSVTIAEDGRIWVCGTDNRPISASPS